VPGGIGGWGAMVAAPACPTAFGAGQAAHTSTARLSSESVKTRGKMVILGRA